MTTALEDTPLKIEGDLGFVITGKELRRLISAVALAYVDKPLMTVTRHIIMEASPTSLSFTATNLSSFVTAATHEVVVTEAGRIGVYGSQLLKMRRQLSDDAEIKVTTHESVATFSTGTASWGLRLNDIKMFPQTPELPEDSVDLDREKFVASVESVVRAAATDLVRHSLMMVDVADQTMRASDAVRYQQVYTPWWPKDLAAAIPSAAVPKIIQFFKRTEAETIRFQQSDQYLGFSFPGESFIVAKPAAKFAMMDDLLLKPAIAHCSLKFTCNLWEFHTALSRLDALSDAGANLVRIEMQDEFFSIWTEDRMGNSASAQVSLISSEVPSGTQMAFNHKHLTDLLAMTGGEEVGDFYVGTDKKTKKTPLLYRGSSQGILGVLSQMRLT